MSPLVTSAAGDRRHPHRHLHHRHRMEIVIENPSESTPTAAVAVAAAAAATATAPATVTAGGTATATATVSTSAEALNDSSQSPSPSFSMDTTLRYSQRHDVCEVPDIRPFPVYIDDYCAGPGYHHSLTPVDMNLDGAPTTATIRRVNKSGLLEMSDLDVPGCRGLKPLGAENMAGHIGTLGRRIDRSGLLEAVPEIPDQRIQRAPEAGSEGMIIEDSTIPRISSEVSVEDCRTICTSPRMSESSGDCDVNYSDPRRRIPMDVCGLPENMMAGQGFFATEKTSDCPHSGIRLFPETSVSPTVSPVPPSPLQFQGYVKPNQISPILTSPLVGARGFDESRRSRNRHSVQFAVTDNLAVSYGPSGSYSTEFSDTIRPCTKSHLYPSSPSTISRFHGTNSLLPLDAPLIPIQRTDLSREEVTDRLAGVGSATKTDASSRSVIRGPSPLPSRLVPPSTSTSIMTSTTATLTTGFPTEACEIQRVQSSVSENENELELPEGERAEAEGCEHSSVEGIEESSTVSFKKSNELLCKDNVQTLRVIILSEQL